MHRSASSGVALSAAILLTALLTGCGQQAGPPASTTTAPGTSSPSVASPTPSQTTTAGTPSASPTASADWTTYRTTDGQLVFDLPSTWKVRDPAGPVPPDGGVFVEVANAAGKPMAALRTNMVTGSECMEKLPFSVLDSQPIPALAQGGSTPRFMFETRGDVMALAPSTTTVASYGITSDLAPTGDKAYCIFHLFAWPPSGAMFGAGYNPANNATPGDSSTPYLEKAKKYAQTAEYQDIKRMITSLRPVS